MTDKSLQFVFDNMPHLVDERDALLAWLIRFADGLLAEGARPFCLQSAAEDLAALLSKCEPDDFPSLQPARKDNGGWRDAFHRTLHEKVSA